MHMSNTNNDGYFMDAHLDMWEDFWKSKQWNSVNIAMAACPTLPGKCPGDKERSYYSTDADAHETIRFTQFNDYTYYYYHGSSDTGQPDYDFCTYKIHAATGAPGFNIKSDIASQKIFVENWTSDQYEGLPQLYASWVEYDALHLLANSEYGTWPPRF